MNLRVIVEPKGPITSENLLEEELNRLTGLRKKLEHASHSVERLEILDAIPEVQDYFSSPSPLRTYLAGVSNECEEVIKAVFAIKQGKHLFDVPDSIQNPAKLFHQLLNDLLAIDHFYANVGGIIGYQCLSLSLIIQTDEQSKEATFLPPNGQDLAQEDLITRQMTIEGIRRQGEMAEIYPVGGAADRLQLKDESTGKGLPAACLVFQGKHLLEGVICDLQAREYLHYKLFDAQIVTPLGLLTSQVNHNHDHIQEICLKNRWFGRPRESFKFFTQPSIPVFNRKGEWCLKKPLKLLLRPGGHGVLWKLAEDKGVFDWLEGKGRKKALIRQINNPMAAVDYGLMAFLGVGHDGDKAFGFASCERRVNAHEGMNVLKVIDGKRKVLTNVEYCDFKKYGIDDEPRKEGEEFSLFPSNTNILFANLEAVRNASKQNPFPGLLVNFREDTHLNGKEDVARLETTMQNIADTFEVPQDAEKLPTYVTFNQRRKTISTTKRKSASQGKMLETPEGCFYDFMQNAEDLLGNHCGVKLSLLSNESAFLRDGPPFLVNYHPALGPLYSIIKQKIHGGEIVYGSELQLEISDLEMKNLYLDGSLLILADNLMGHMDDTGELVYSNQTGQCRLTNVRVENDGIDWQAEDHLFWKHEIKRSDNLTVHLQGHSRFEADGVTFKGGQTIEVPDGVHLIAKQVGSEIVFDSRPLDQGPFWTYETLEDASIQIKKGS